ncbi:MAG: hypothetical protein ABJA70_23000 [Chryseolinea sp.]
MKGQLKTGVPVVSDAPETEIKAIKIQPGREIITFGSPSTAHALMEF